MAAFNLASLLRAQVQQRPFTPALIVNTGRGYTTLTFAQLDAESDAYAYGLKDYGLAPGQRVLLLVTPSARLLTLGWSLLKLGCVPVVIDLDLPRADWLACVQEIEPHAFIGVPLAHLLRLRYPRPFPRALKLVTAGPRLGWGGASLAELRRPTPSPFPLASTQAHSPAAIVFTTGSTGLPKGAVWTHGQLAAQCESLRALFHLQPGDVDLAAYPFSALLDAALGLTAVLPQTDFARPARADVARLVASLRDHRASFAFFSPTLWERVADYCETKNITLPSMRRPVMAGAPVRFALHERVKKFLGPDGDTYAPYGSTEALPLTSISGRELTAARAANPDPTAGTCLGRPAPGLTLRIIQLTDEAVEQWTESLGLPPNSIGEITVTGAHVTTEYFRRPEAERLAKIKDGARVWHRTGDVGYLDEEGRLWFCGRKAHRVTLADGTTLHTDPCENVFDRHLAVKKSALVGVKWEEGVRPVMVIEPREWRAPFTSLEKDLRALASGYPLTARITTFLFHRRLPVDIRHNAKIERGELARWAEKQL